MQIREAMKMIEMELGKRFLLKEDWKEQIPNFLHTHQCISLPDAIIEDEWNSRFMLRLSELSRQYAEELQQEFGKYGKAFVNGRLAYELNLWQAPPTRMLSLAIILSAWLGWILVTHGNPVPIDKAKQKLDEAFEFGKKIALRNQRP